MKRTLVRRRSWRSTLLCILLAVFLVPFVVGCSDDDDDDEFDNEGDVEICNYDQEGPYDIELRRSFDAAIVGTATLGSGAVDPECVYFEDVNVGAYFVSAELRGTDFLLESEDFFIDDINDTLSPLVTIEEDGDIRVSGGVAGGEGELEVCNGDDEDYIVELVRDIDGTVIDAKDINDIFSVNDICRNFDDIPAGPYFIRLLEDNSSRDLVDISEIFFISDDEIEFFDIDSTGSLDRETD